MGDKYGRTAACGGIMGVKIGERLLLNVRDGLGDACQQGIVLKHLRKTYPKLRIGVIAPIGVHSVFTWIADDVYPNRHPHDWREVYTEAETYDLKFQWPEETYVSICAMTAQDGTV